MLARLLRLDLLVPHLFDQLCLFELDQCCAYLGLRFDRPVSQTDLPLFVLAALLASPAALPAVQAARPVLILAALQIPDYQARHLPVLCLWLPQRVPAAPDL